MALQLAMLELDPRAVVALGDEADLTSLVFSSSVSIFHSSEMSQEKTTRSGGS